MNISSMGYGSSSAPPYGMDPTGASALNSSSYMGMTSMTGMAPQPA